MPLTAKQQRFVAEYLVDLNATQAAIRCGYAAKTARQQGSRLLSHVDIEAAISTAKAQQLDSAEISAVRVLQEYGRLAFVDARAFWHADGRVKAMHELTADQGAAIAGFEAQIKNVQAGDGQTDLIHKFKLWDKTRALEALAKHFGLLEDRVDHSGEIVVRWGGQ